MTKQDAFPRLRIRRATPDDADVVSDLTVRTMVETYPQQFGSKEAVASLEARYTPEAIRTELERDDILTLLGYWDDTPMGFTKLILNCPCEHLPDPDAVYFEKAYLLREYQNKGIGGHSFRGMVEQLKAMGFRRGWLGVWEGNKLAIAFHEQQGFRAVGTTEYRYDVGGEERVDTDIVMTVDLSAL